MPRDGIVHIDGEPVDLFERECRRHPDSPELIDVLPLDEAVQVEAQIQEEVRCLDAVLESIAWRRIGLEREIRAIFVE